MRPSVVTAVLLLVGIINTVTVLSANPKETCSKLIDSECDEPGWIRFKGSHCMRYIRDRKNFEEAQEHCQCMDSELMSIHNEEENNHAMCMGYYYRNPSHPVPFWFGAVRAGAGFKFTDGTEFKYTKWNPNEPNNDKGTNEGCVETNRFAWGKWNDIPCNLKRDYVCMKKK